MKQIKILQLPTKNKPPIEWRRSKQIYYIQSYRKKGIKKAIRLTDNEFKIRNNQHKSLSLIRLEHMKKDTKQFLGTRPSDTPSKQYTPEKMYAHCVEVKKKSNFD